MLIDKITFAGTSSPSWPKAARGLSQLVGVKVSAIEVSRITQQIGQELIENREREVFRTCVATLKDVHGFGPLVAVEAGRRGFYDAALHVFLGDGDHKNWTIHKLHLPHFTAITDFGHPVTYRYDAAAAVTSSWSAHWEQDPEWLIACWGGRVSTVLAELNAGQQRLGLPEKETPENDPRQVVAKTLTYLTNNQASDRVRCQGRTVRLSVRTAGPYGASVHIVTSLNRSKCYRLKQPVAGWDSHRLETTRLSRHTE